MQPKQIAAPHSSSSQKAQHSMSQWQSEQTSPGLDSACVVFALMLVVLPFVQLVDLEGGLRRVRSKQYSDQTAVRGGDWRGLRLVLDHELRHLDDPDVGTKRAGPGPHHPLDRFALPRVELLVP